MRLANRASGPQFEAITLVMLAGIFCLYAYAACALILAPRHFAALMSEMGPLETMGTLACFVAAVLFFGAFGKTLASRNFGRAMWLFGLALGTSFLVLEEISWGQHIFGFETPASIAALNVQHETNFHNFRGIHFQSHELGILVLFAFFVVTPLLATHEQLARLFEALKMPLVPLQISALFAFSYAGFEAFRVLYRLFPLQPPVNYGELQEAAYELIILLFAVTLWRPQVQLREAAPR